MTPPTPNKCKIKCDMFTCICADGSEAHDPPTQKEPECIEGLREDRTLRFGTTITRMGVVDILAAYDALKAKLDAAEKDKERLDWLADDPPFDGLGDHDLYECWHMVAHENGHEEATQDDRRKAFRRLLDAARTAATAQGE
jgi:hypothetical protein